MTFRFVSLKTTLVAVLALLALGTSASAEERHREFLELLRERLYFDTALEFLDAVESRPGLDAATKAVLVYERAVTLQEYAQTTRDPDDRVRMLDDAEKLLDNFAQQYPGDERIADANSRRAKILLDKAESEVYRAESPSNAAQSGTLRERARGYVATARKVFTTARAQHEERYKSFPKFTEDDAVKAERTEAEYQMIQARIDLAMCTYMEARTYPDGVADRERLFGQAAEEFRAIRDDHRRQIAGLHAELWEAKCYEEQGELDRAIPLYDRLVEPGDDDPRNVPASLQELRDQALRFKLGCWNKKEEYRLVYNAANEDTGWLKNAGRRAEGLNGLGVRWELARAEEQLAYEAKAEAKRLDDIQIAQEKRGDDRSVPQAERTVAKRLANEAKVAAKEARDAYSDLLNDALTRSRTIAQYATHYQEVAVVMSNRLQVELEGSSKDPESFKEGFVQLQLRISEIQSANKAVEDAKDPEVRRTKVEEQRQLLESTRRLAELTIALSRASDAENVEAADVDRAWYLFSYVAYQMGHDFDAAVIGGNLLRSRKVDNPAAARDGAFLAIAAMQHAYHDGRAKDDPLDHAEEFAILVEIANDLVTTWPNEKLSDDARMLVADEYARRSEPTEAAHWFTGVSETSPSYLEAQLKAGQAYYGSYVRAANLDPDDRPDTETLDGWRAKALEHLKLGVEKQQSETPADATDAQKFELIRGKITLAEILIADAREQEAVDLLSNDPHSVLKAIEVPEGAARPEAGVKSVAFAKGTYELLLRAYIGLSRTDEALQVMEQLEAVAGGADVNLYQGLGQNLEKEIERLRGLGEEDRLVKVRTAFDEFLGKVYERRAALGYNGLMWVAQTYFSLATGMGDDPAAADYYADAADVYAEVIDQAGADPQFAPDVNLTYVQLQLVKCRAQAGEYDRAYDLVLKVLIKQPQAMDAQLVTSKVLQGWAESGPADAVQKFKQAMLGGDVMSDGTPVKLYGFQKIAEIYGGALSAGTLSEEDGMDRLVEAYERLIQSQRGMALAMGKPEELGRAMMLFGGVRNLGGSLNDEQKERFQTLYHSVQDDLGVAHTAINWPANIESKPPPPPPPPKKLPVDAEPEVVAEKEESGGGYITAILGFLLAIGAAVGCYVMMAKPKKKRTYLSSEEPEPSFAGVSAADKPRRKKRPVEGTPTRRAPSGKPAGGKPVGDEPRAAAKKKRPRPKE